MLLSDVLNKYIEYLDALGFVEFSCDPNLVMEGQATVFKPKTLVAPNTDFAIKLKNAIANVNEYSPDVDEQIQKYLK